MRPGRVWTVNNRNSIEPLPVKIGVSDDRYTEIAGPDVSEGMQVVTRMRTTRD